MKPDLRTLRRIAVPALVAALAPPAATAAPPKRTARPAAKAPATPPVSKAPARAKAPAKAAAKPPVPATAPPAGPVVRLRVEPAQVSLEGARAAQRLLVTGVLQDGGERDLTDEVRYVSLAPKVAAVGADGRVTPVADGTAKIVARAGSLSAAAVVTVTGAEAPAEISFVNDVMPLLSKAGCNGSACHGSPAGKGSLKLSLFGYEPELDHAAVTKAEAKLVDRQNPEKSLLLAKPTLGVAHAGGQRFKAGSPEHGTLLAWLKAGAPGIGDLEARVKSLAVTPAERLIGRAGQKQRLLVTAHFSDGSRLDVTDQAIYSVNDDSIVEVDDRGRMTGRAPGETAVMVRHLGQVAVARVAVLPPWTLPKEAPRPARAGFIDEIVFDKLERLRVLPSARSTDEEFLRRVYLDACGLLPTPDEARAFLDSKDPQKRAKLIDALLAREEHVDVWALKWGDMLRNNPRLTTTGALLFHDWIREQVAKNAPVDEFVRALLTASGRNGETTLRQKKDRQRDTYDDLPVSAPANYFMVAPNALDITSHTSQVFLGVRIECARCHNHPFEKWTQNDYYGLAANFSGVRLARAANNRVGFVLPPQPEPERPAKRKGKVRVAKQSRGNNVVRHPKTNEPMEPAFLDGTEPKASAGDPRVELAAWITAPENPFFARNIANRVWAHYFGRGIVDPVDDVRVTNPPSNPELLDALAKELVAHRFDLRHLERVILNSQVYQLSSVQNPYNRQDTANFARAYPRRLTAEQLYDSISQATAVFDLGGGQRGRKQALKLYRNLATDREITRAAQIPTPTAGGPVGDFLKAFGRPQREVTCECERTADGNIGQALILINGDVVNAKLAARQGRVKQLAAGGKPDEAVIEELFLAAFSRRPTPAELKDTLPVLKSAPNREAGVQDILWSLLNSREFLFNH